MIHHIMRRCDGARPHLLALSLVLSVVFQTGVGFSMSQGCVRVPSSRPTAVTCFAANDDDDADFMAGLRSRVEEVNDSATKLPLVVLDSMLPRQVLKIQVANPLLMELVVERVRNETPVFGMLGMARLITGQQIHLKHGVEVEIVEREFVDDSVKLVLKAGRRFTIQGELENVGGWTEGRVEFLNSEEQESREMNNGEDRMSVARAVTKAMELTSPNLTMRDNMSLVDRWIELAKVNERTPGQIDELLEQLGEIPPYDEPSERAFWIGALINPTPAMGVAMEVRPPLLTAKTAEERIQVALDGIFKSIKHMDGSERMW